MSSGRVIDDDAERAGAGGAWKYRGGSGSSGGDCPVGKGRKGGGGRPERG